jgi:phage terminase large subunit GpA-like protein
LYRGIFKDAEYDNMSVKQVGNASIFFAVSNSRNNFTSFPADDLIIDELDECNLENIEMAPERLAFSRDPQEIRVANPTYPEIGIDWEFQKSDKKYWHIKCPCGHVFVPDFFKNVVRQIKDDKRC